LVTVPSLSHHAGGAGQHDVGELGGAGEEDVLDHEVVEAAQELRVRSLSASLCAGFSPIT
jgi:hypothetical protein